MTNQNISFISSNLRAQVKVFYWNCDRQNNAALNHSLRRSRPVHILICLQRKQECTYKWVTRPLLQDPQSDGDFSFLNRDRRVRPIRRGANISWIDYLHWWRTPPAGTITERRCGSEGSSCLCPTGNGSPQGATAPRRKAVSFLPINTLVSFYSWQILILYQHEAVLTFHGRDKVGSVLSYVCGQDGKETLQLLVCQKGLEDH